MDNVIKKAQKKRQKRNYFTQETEDAIVLYNKTKSSKKRSKIYQDKIHFAFFKLTQNIIHTFKFYYFDVSSEDVKNEVVSFLVMNMHKFQAGKGKAFSYFSIVAKNYLILHNNNNYKKMKMQDSVDVLDHKKPYKSTNPDHLFEEEFIIQMLEYWENNLTNVFRRQKDIHVADAVLEIFRRRKNIENFNKKALYILIREMTGSNTQHITRIVNVMKKYHYRMFQEFHSTGEIDTANTGSIF